MTDAENLPHAERAVVPREKLEGYLLNLGHEVGRHKARVFGAALGMYGADERETKATSPAKATPA
jgi:hypothetical protein